jgi:hypothetical protein
MKAVGKFRVIVGVAVVCIIFVLWFILREKDGGRGRPLATSVSTSKGTASIEGQNGIKAGAPQLETHPAIAAILATPIKFYGRVQTQEGLPIEAAVVNATVATRFGGGSEKRRVLTDERGFFSISAQGMTLAIQVAKEGFFKIPEGKGGGLRSSGSFDYGADLGSRLHRPDPDKPVIFTLFKPMSPEILSRINERETVVPRNGDKVRVVLDDSSHILELRLSTDEAIKGRDGRYSWRLEISIPDGGIQLRLNEFDFVAPEAGYKTMEVIAMPGHLPRPEWQDDVERSYWVRFRDGLFGRVKVRMIAGGAHYSIVSGYINPNEGSRNLTADPK